MLLVVLVWFMTVRQLLWIKIACFAWCWLATGFRPWCDVATFFIQNLVATGFYDFTSDFRAQSLSSALLLLNCVHLPLDSQASVVHISYSCWVMFVVHGRSPVVTFILVYCTAFKVATCFYDYTNVFSTHVLWLVKVSL